MDGDNQVVREGSSEATAAAVRLLPEDREQLKTLALRGEAQFSVPAIIRMILVVLYDRADKIYRKNPANCRILF